MPIASASNVRMVTNVYAARWLSISRRIVEEYTFLTHLGRSTYYRCKQKRRLIRPKEQAYIKKLFLAHGISTEPRYDEYQEYYDLG